MIPHRSYPRLAAAFFALSITLVGWNHTALAQSTESAANDTTVQIPAELTTEQVNDLVARLSDEEVRGLLIRQLGKVAATDEPTEPKGAAIDRLMFGLNNAERRITDVAAVMGDVTQVPSEIWRRITEGSDAGVWGVLLKILIFFAAGLVAEKLFRRSVTNIQTVEEPGSPPAFKTKLRLSFLRAIIDVVSIFIFFFGAVIAWLVSELPTDNAHTLFTTLLSGVLVWRLVNTASRMILSPKVSWVRLVDVDDASARSAYSKLMLISSTVIFVLWWPGELMRDLGLNPAIVGVVALFTSAIFIASVILVIWQLRPVRSGTSDDGRTQDYFAQNWHIIAIIGALLIYTLALGVNFATGVRTLEPAIASLILLGFIPILDITLRGVVHRFMGEGEDEHPAANITRLDLVDAEQAAEAAGTETTAVEDEPVTATAQSQTYESAVRNNIRILLFLFAIFAFAGIWDLNLFGLLEALFGERMTKVIVNFSVTALLAYSLWSIVSTAVARVAGPEPEAGGAHGGDGGGVGGSRLSTVLPLFKKFLFITLIVMLTLTLLSSLGVNIGPLIAGAGILGIAIGFGAQTLVKDIVSGLFFLLDDAFRIGEYVNIGNTKGTVEKISVRSVRLRHHNGPLHTVPFGEIQTLTNWSRDWAIMKFEIRVPFETDVDMVRRIIKKVGTEMLEDAELGPLFLAPLKSQGVNRMDDSSFIIRCKFTAIPGNQFIMRREAFVRIQKAFEQKGIKFAPRRVIVETTTPESPTNAAAAASAAAALDAPGQQQDQGKDEPG